MKNKIFGVLALSFFSFSFLQCTGSKTPPADSSASPSIEKMGPLATQLKEMADASAEKTPAEKRQIMLAAIEKLKSEEISKKALKEGAVLPLFFLPDISRGGFNSKEMNKKGPLVITFYRGSWCPYCNLQLRDLQKRLPEIKALGAELVAISPEKPDRTAEKVKKEGIEYYVLSDVNGIVSRKFGLAFSLPEDLRQVYLDFGINLEEANGNDKWELPLAATYVVSREGKIVYAFIDADYKLRAETEDIISVLKKL